LEADFNQGELPAAFIRSIAAHDKGSRVALIINGDSVDFIADQNAKYFDPEGAIGKLDNIIYDPNFADVFVARISANSLPFSPVFFSNVACARSRAAWFTSHRPTTRASGNVE
jgi:hypothetical protein